ncbi:hypothetical protein OBBRIDRAFT_809459 [Obba rivulosa]|uniref:Arrestin-like N-terminal domain-containing protein n=1 Tax=Obba rivulosa TaxID=1052685 RepID=A0A8E2DU64_9APHY|nr:hypothetical protein OBBRIDRAFT_809459 [Obba rivulosa]
MATEKNGLSHDSELPSYFDQPRSAAGTEHRYQLEDSGGKAWIWMSIKSRAREPHQLPLFYEQDILTGTVEVDFDKTSGAKAVTITATAGVTAVGQDEDTFLKITHTLWDAKESTSTKPKGKHTWPFSVSVPSEVAISDKFRPKQPLKTYPLPPTFSERASPAYVDYKLVVTVRRGAFKVNHTLATSWVYWPITRADPPSHLRQIAYDEGSPLIGPEGDPEGWKVLPPVKITGTVFSSRQVEVLCTIAIAKPLSCAAGSPFPIFLTLTGSDEQALDLLASPSSPKLHLTRTRAIGEGAAGGAEAGRTDNVFVQSVGSAFFWLSSEGAVQAGTRTLQGELDVKKGLKQSFALPGFALWYSLALYPFSASGFSSAVPATEPLLTESVTITSSNAVGITPRSYAPPGYDKKDEGDYNTAAGYLENGNQRFLHHGGFM